MGGDYRYYNIKEEITVVIIHISRAKAIFLLIFICQDTESE